MSILMKFPSTRHLTKITTTKLHLVKITERIHIKKLQNSNQTNKVFSAVSQSTSLEFTGIYGLYTRKSLTICNDAQFHCYYAN